MATNIPFQELADSPVEHYGAQGVTATRKLIVSAANKTAMINKLLGDGYEFGGQLAANYPGNSNVAVKNIDVEPFYGTPDYAVFTDPETQINSFTGKFLLLTVQYEPIAVEGNEPDTPENNLGNGSYGTYEMDHGVENVSIPGWAQFWEDEPTEPIDIDKQFGVQRCLTTIHKLTYHRVVNPPWKAMRLLAGCVNAAEFFGAAAETMRFDGAKASKEFAGFDDFAEPQFRYKLEYTFTERRLNALEIAQNEVGILGDPIGWNHFFRSTGPIQGWRKIYFYDGAQVAANKRYRFPPVDFAPLFAASMEPVGQ